MSDNETITIEQVQVDRDEWRRIARRLQRELSKATYGPDWQRVAVLQDRLEDRDIMIMGLKRRVKSLKQSVEYRNLQLKEMRK